ncbi:hypothetical protein [Mangrovimonas spongiae]|uniref:DUF4868 domain-containing protein n=1 Tax=Mangrovimonas spongiae TaxID=2494697 RepID=A0A428K4J3_9FLAO|nr:hypothetical protein [Mangrovimonas spongiae]RSK41327.1 hypothetical protein EJA19_00195 [Mangrovimonas spongiae]
MASKKVKRTINYFNIVPLFNDGQELSDFIDIFSTINNLSNTKDKDRFVINKEKRLYITNLSFNENQKRISGKLLNIRMDSFPELMNTSDDKIRDIEAADDEGIIETAHFILSYLNDSLVLSFEFNQFGPRISDFIYYLENISYRFDVLTKIEYQPFVRDELDSYKKRIKRVSSVIAKVHKDDVRRINEFDSELFDAFETAERISDAEYVTLQLNYDYRQLSDTPKIKDKIFNIIDSVRRDKSLLNVFSSLKVKAEDEQTANRIKDFDLLNIWVKSRINVEKKEKSRVIISSDILLKMNQELTKEFK